MRLRKAIFWLHLFSGIGAGVIIVVMSVTGIAIAFEAEILNWIDRDISVVKQHGSDRQSIERLLVQVKSDYPDFRVTGVQIPKDYSLAYEFQQGREARLYVDPFTGESHMSEAGPAHDVLHFLEDIHRYLGMHGDGQETGKLITGVANFMFFILCLTGLYLWFPRKWSRRAVRSILWFRSGAKGRARNFNWHNVFGIWSVPVLVVLVGTAVVISFAWSHKLVFAAFGEKAPEFRDFRMMLLSPATVPEAPENTKRLSFDEILARIENQFPDRLSINIHFPRGQTEGAPIAPQYVDIMEPALFSTMGYVPLQLDPFTGKILKVVRHGDRSPGLRARLWVRFLHTGEAFGFIGKVIASLATVGSLFLVYTGFALSYRRFFGRRR